MCMGNRSRSAGGLPLGPPAGAARSNLEAGRVGDLAGGNQVAVRSRSHGGVKGQAGEAFLAPRWLCER
jgi:hypothetical protein